MIHRHNALLIALAALAGATCAAARAQDNQAVSRAVASCVNVVHQTKPPSDQPFMNSFYKDFDAFYNTASGLVENNAQTVGDQRAFFVFQKCMAQQGYPLTRPNQERTTHEGDPKFKCSPEELDTKNGNCWLKLTASEKLVFAAGFWNGSWARYLRANELTHAAREEEISSDDLPSVNYDEHIKYLNELYADPKNLGISFFDAYQLLAMQRFGKPSDIANMTKLFRRHERPPREGYLVKFVPPNKLVLAEYSDAEGWRDLREKYGDRQQTVTLYGLSSHTANPAFVQFMDALVRIKHCKGYVTVDQYGKANWKQTWPFQAYSGLRLKVAIMYPSDNPGVGVYDRYFDENGDLSGIVLLPANETICYSALDAPALNGPSQIKLKQIVLARDDIAHFRYPYLEDEAKDNWIDLNKFVLVNGLQDAEEYKTDEAARSHNLRFNYSFALQYEKKTSPSPGIDATLKVGH